MINLFGDKVQVPVDEIKLRRASQQDRQKQKKIKEMMAKRPYHIYVIIDDDNYMYSYCCQSFIQARQLFAEQVGCDFEDTADLEISVLPEFDRFITDLDKQEEVHFTENSPEWLDALYELGGYIEGGHHPDWDSDDREKSGPRIITLQEAKEGWGDECPVHFPKGQPNISSLA